MPLGCHLATTASAKVAWTVVLCLQFVALRAPHDLHQLPLRLPYLLLEPLQRRAVLGVQEHHSLDALHALLLVVPGLVHASQQLRPSRLQVCEARLQTLVLPIRPLVDPEPASALLLERRDTDAHALGGLPDRQVEELRDRVAGDGGERARGRRVHAGRCRCRGSAAGAGALVVVDVDVNVVSVATIMIIMIIIIILQSIATREDGILLLLSVAVAVAALPMRVVIVDPTCYMLGMHWEGRDGVAVCCLLFDARGADGAGSEGTGCSQMFDR